MRTTLDGRSFGTLLAVGLIVGSAVWSRPVASQTQLPPLAPRDMAMTMSGSFTLVSVGDLIIRRPASQLADDGVQAALQLIKDGDVAIGNMEGSLSRMRRFDGPMRSFMGTHEVAADLKAMGFDLVNRANNHLFDSESEGMFATNALLDEAGIVHAGSGRNLDEAMAPAFLELPHGRVALVGMHTPNGVASRRLAATHREGNLGGRPGLNMLNFSEAIVVTEEQLAALRGVRNGLLEHRGNYDNPRPAPNDESSDRLRFFNSSSGREDATYRAARPGETPGTIDFSMNADDLERILRSVRNAKQYADFVIATIHAHQSQSVVERFHLSTRPPAFYVDLAHQAIDSGADAFVGHGVHTLRGVEIYNGKPIFYGLGEFFREMQWSLAVQLGMTDATPGTRTLGGSSQSLESMVAVSRYENGELAEVRLHPIELGYDGPDSRLGIPRLAPPQIGRRILERVQRLSRDLGTTIDIENNVGVIRVWDRPTGGAN